MILDRQLDTMLRQQAVCGLLARDAAALIAVLAPLWEEMSRLQARLRTWLSGDNPTTTDRVRAMAALETLAVALKAPTEIPGLAEAELRATLLDVATGVLGLQ